MLKSKPDEGSSSQVTPGWRPRGLEISLCLSAFGLIASAIVHAVTFFGIAPQRVFPPVWMLHVLAVLLVFPFVLVAGKHIRTFNDRMNWTKIATRNAPRWLRYLTKFLFAYVLFNCVYVLGYLGGGSPPSIVDGEMVLMDHGNIIRKLTAIEYELRNAYTIRGVSSFWLLFYTWETAVFLSERRES